MKRLMPIRETPAEPSWWKNQGRGRRLVCKCKGTSQDVVMHVPASDAFCGKCAKPMKVRTAPPEAAERLGRSA